jgi:DNA-binding IclR family transcriptional regulator
MDDDAIHPATEKLAILVLLQQHPDRPFTVTDLAERIRAAPSRVQRILDLLMESGLAARTRTVSGGEIGYVSLAMTLDPAMY